MELQVGQKLWFVPSRAYGTPREVEIKKIGRKWTYTERHHQVLRIDLETLRPHDLDEQGQCYLSCQHYEEWQARQDSWRKFCMAVDKTYRLCPDGVTVEKIEAARRPLGLHEAAK